MMSFADEGAEMRRFAAGLVFVALFAGLTGCKKKDNSIIAAGSEQSEAPEAQIRTAIQAHLAHITNLNLEAFDTDIKQVTVAGDHAQAQVDFQVKGGPGVMQLTYQLEKREGNWAVVDSNPAGSNFSHPPLDQGQEPPASASGGSSHSLADTLRSFKSGDGAPPSSLPPGHPPVAGTSSPMTQQ